MTQNIDVHTHVVPENFPAYAGRGRDVPWPSMAIACLQQSDSTTFA